MNKSVDIFFNRDHKVTNDIYWHEYPDDVHSVASAAQSSFSIKVMQFIGLHELGHIVNGDFDIMDYHKMYMLKDDEKISNIDSISKSHELEYKADLFAFENLFANIEEDIQKWSTFYSIYYFFMWLNLIEYKNGEELSKIHPSPLDRACRLKNEMMKITNDDLGFLDLLDELDRKIQTYMES